MTTSNIFHPFPAKEKDEGIELIADKIQAAAKKEKEKTMKI